MQQRVEELERQVTEGLIARSDELSDFRPQPEAPRNGTREPHIEVVQDMTTNIMSEHPPQVSLNLSCSLGAFPGSSLTGLPISDSGQSPNTRTDLITRGVLSLATAERLYQFYHQNLDHYIYNLLGKEDTLSVVRSRSSLLTSAICTVAGYCYGADVYPSCLEAFRDEVAAELFSTDHSFDDIRALCIASYWLKELSATLSTMGK